MHHFESDLLELRMTILEYWWATKGVIQSLAVSRVLELPLG